MRIERPVRVMHSYTQHLDFPVDEVFPLLCPVRESDWIETWNPTLVLTTSGNAELQCTFITGSGADTATWVVTRHEPPEVIEFVRFGPGPAVTHISITLRAVGRSRCTADIAYAITALPGGEHIVAAFGEDQYRQFMETWQMRIEHYLRTGQMLRSATAS